MKKYPSGMVSVLQLKTTSGQPRSATGGPGRVAHGRRGARHGDLCVAHRGRVFAVHTGGVWAALRAVRAMKAAKPIRAPSRNLSQGFAEGFAARLLRAGFVVARGNPGVGSPRVVKACESLEVPAPLDDSVACGENAEETKRVHAVERQVC